MALETGTYVSDLNINNPTITDQIDQGDDHIRLIKKTIKIRPPVFVKIFNCKFCFTTSNSIGFS